MDTGAVAVPPLRMPAEWEPHERTLICWPARDEIWGPLRVRACEDHATIARTVAEFEPVTVIAPPSRAEEAARACGPTVHVEELPIDDSWARDSGPLSVLDGRRRRAVLDVTFNGWGRKFEPFADDAALARRWADRHGVPVVDEAMVLEGGAITVDGAGTVVTTEQCLLHPNRNPTMSRAAIEGVLRTGLGAERTVWLPYGLVDDHDTDGHVDNVAAFAQAGLVVAQGCDDVDEPDHERLGVNLRCLRDAPDARGEPIAVLEVPVLPFAHLDGRRVPVPYLNLYVCNGGVVVPVCGHAADDEMLGLIGTAFPGRRVVGVPGEVLAYGGGGPHCITQQVPLDPVGGSPFGGSA
ncbi:MAG: agmatine deiminase family protein [Microthrixaceae bacterium]